MSRHTRLALIVAAGLAAGGATAADARTTPRLANALSNDHPTSVAPRDVADTVEGRTGGEVSIRLFPNGIPGSKTGTLEQLKQGAPDMTRASAEVWKATRPEGFVGLTIFDSDARSFHTKDRRIETPDDLRGIKLRVLPSNNSIRMPEMMGGPPTPMA